MVGCITSLSIRNSHPHPQEVQRVEAKDRLLFHPKYFIYAGFHALCSDGMYDNRQEALKIDSEDFIAHCNTVPCYINIKNNQTSISDAIQAFDRAIELLKTEIEIRELLEIFHDRPTPSFVRCFDKFILQFSEVKNSDKSCF
ncbi:hypothetical protein I4U23_022807 [Adineta vaga]|nr:hypothetical protein I4U23_022807 [Adineta vaga]